MLPRSLTLAVTRGGFDEPHHQALVVIVAFFLGQTNVLWAQQRSRGSVSATSRGSVSRSGNTASWESRSGKAQGFEDPRQNG